MAGATRGWTYSTGSSSRGRSPAINPRRLFRHPLTKVQSGMIERLLGGQRPEFELIAALPALVNRPVLRLTEKHRLRCFSAACNGPEKRPPVLESRTGVQLAA